MLLKYILGLHLYTLPKSLSVKVKALLNYFFKFCTRMIQDKINVG